MFGDFWVVKLRNSLVIIGLCGLGVFVFAESAWLGSRAWAFYGAGALVILSMVGLGACAALHVTQKRQ